MQLNIGLKLGFWLALLGTLSTGLTAYYVYERSHALLIAEAQEKLLANSRALSNHFNEALLAITHDVDFLSRLPLSRDIASLAAQGQALDENKRQQLAGIFSALLSTHSEYSQIRLLDAQHFGKEWVRVDRDHQGISVVANDQLQEKHHFPYVFETLNLPVGQLYVSDINLNQELGTHQGFGQPTLRVALASPSPQQTPAAIIVINANLNDLFAQIRHDLPANIQLLLTNHHGDYLIHSDADKTFGFERGRSFLIQDDIVATRPLLQGDTDWLVFAGQDENRLGSDFLAAFVKQPLIGQTPKRFLLIGLYTAMDDVLLESQALGRQTMQLTALFSMLTIFIALALARILAKPLKTITQVVSQFELGQPLQKLPVERQDEIGYLAQSFQGLAEQLNSKVAQLFSSEAKLHAILDHAPISIWLAGIDGRYQFVNNTFCAALGIGESQCKANTSLENLLGKTCAEKFRQADQHCLANPKAVHQTYDTWVLADGRAHRLEITRAPFYDISGNVVGIIGIGMDITDRERAAERERARNRVLELLSKGAALPEILDAVITVVETQNPALISCIQLLTDDGQRLASITAAQLPDCYKAAIEELNRGQAACGERVIAPDIQQHPDWTALQEIAAYAGLGACWSEPIRSAEGKLLGVFSIYQREPASPTTQELEQLEQAANLAAVAIERSRIHEALQLASLVYQNSSEAMAVTDAKGTIITINPAFTELTGYSASEVIGKNHGILRSNRQNKQFYQNLWATLNTVGFWKGELWNRRKNGEVFAESLTINTIFNPDGRPHRRVALFSDITQKKQSEELIWTQANFDPLTHLPNRRMFHERLQQELKKAHRSGLPMAVLFLDLDRFKEVNDTLGHDVGDLLLIDAAQRLRSCVRETDTIARLGGDEFTLILPELVDMTSVERIAQAILLKLAEPFNLKNKLAYVSGSIGITFYPKDGQDIETLLKHADQAMYAAKHQGRNGYSHFTPSMQEAALQRMQTAEDLRQALANDQFELYYQPVIDLTTGVIRKAEALLRWRHPKLGLRCPNEFIDIAEDIGILNDIGDWVFQQACQQVGLWRARYHPEFQIGINKSPMQFHARAGQPPMWLNYLQHRALDEDSIVLEITEALLLQASDQIVNTLNALRGAGVQIALDDFGTGYSALAYLKKFDINFIKIDRSFISHLNANSDMGLCEAIIAMAHKLGIQVIAEGIETPLQRDLLTGADCDYGQGHLFSKPLPIAEFEALLQTAGSHDR